MAAAAAAAAVAVAVVAAVVVAKTVEAMAWQQRQLKAEAIVVETIDAKVSATAAWTPW